MQNMTISQTPKVTTLEVMKYISALQQTKSIAESDYLKMVALAKQSMNTGDFSQLLDFTVNLYESNPKSTVLGEIINIILGKTEESRNVNAVV